MNDEKATLDKLVTQAQKRAQDKAARQTQKRLAAIASHYFPYMKWERSLYENEPHYYKFLQDTLRLISQKMDLCRTIHGIPFERKSLALKLKVPNHHAPGTDTVYTVKLGLAAIWRDIEVHAQILDLDSEFGKEIVVQGERNGHDLHADIIYIGNLPTGTYGISFPNARSSVLTLSKLEAAANRYRHSHEEIRSNLGKIAGHNAWMTMIAKRLEQPLLNQIVRDHIAMTRPKVEVAFEPKPVFMTARQIIDLGRSTRQAEEKATEAFLGDRPPVMKTAEMPLDGVSSSTPGKVRHRNGASWKRER